MRFLRDPLVAFLIAGTCIFFVADWLGEEDIPYTVQVSAQDLARLTDQWSMQMSRPPTDAELSGLLDQFIREEIYYREAQRLGLDRDDTIVRRRMVQKLTFLTEDIATAAPLEDDALRDYYAANIDDYRLPSRLSFRHKYFSSDRRDNAQRDANTAMAVEEELGDPFMLQRAYAMRSQRELRDLFGAEFAAAAIALEPSEAWQGPIQSAYGWHILWVTDSAAASVEPFADVRAKVVTDAQQAARSAANEAYFAGLKARYQIQLPSDA